MARAVAHWKDRPLFSGGFLFMDDAPLIKLLALLALLALRVDAPLIVLLACFALLALRLLRYPGPHSGHISSQNFARVRIQDRSPWRER